MSVADWLIKQANAAVVTGVALVFKPAEIATALALTVANVNKTLASFKWEKFTPGLPEYRVPANKLQTFLGKLQPAKLQPENKIEQLEARLQSCQNLLKTRTDERDALLASQKQLQQEMDALMVSEKRYQQRVENLIEQVNVLEQLNRAVKSSQQKSGVPLQEPETPPPLPPRDSETPLPPPPVPKKQERLKIPTPPPLSLQEFQAKGLSAHRQAMLETDEPDEDENEWLDCKLCGEAATFRCADCLNIAYCSDDCQRFDYPYHVHLECKAK